MLILNFLSKILPIPSSNTPSLPAQEEVADSNAVLAHIAEQEQMVIDRLEQTGGPIAVQELREKFAR